MSESHGRNSKKRHEAGFPPSARIRKQAEFDAIYAGNRYVADSTLVITANSTGSGSPRLGLSISRQVGNAVVRNRWKRLIREAFRNNRYRLPMGFDLVIRPRKGAVAEYLRVERSLLELTRRLARAASQASGIRPAQVERDESQPPGASAS